MALLSRRTFLQRFAATAGCFVGYAASAGFSPFATPARADGPADVLFPQGLASADPQPDAVMLWTRVERADGNPSPVDLYVQVSESPDFDQVVLEQAVRATQESDHTVRFLAQGLKPDTRYFYRFFAGSDVTPLLGRTRTAPSADSERPVRYAFVSCQNYEYGYYGAYRRLVVEDMAAPESEQLDFVLHLGDFIYEVIGDVPENEAPARLLGPMPDGSPPWVPDGSKPWWQAGAKWAVSLNDYRYLYRTYLRDPDLQEARARFPFISTWDDHEFTNDAWQTFETYGPDPKPAQRRKVAANQAWFEYVPALLTGAYDDPALPNPAHDFRLAQVEDAAPADPAGDLIDDNTQRALGSLTVYRRLQWGRMVDLLITDDRSYRSAPVVTPSVKELIEGAPMAPVRIIDLLDAGRTANNDNPPQTLTYGDRELANPRASTAPGTMLGQTQKAWFKSALKSSRARWRLWANSVPAASMMLDFGNLPFQNLEDGYVGIDAWQGYPGELRELMRFIREAGVTNIVSCAGDYHAHFCGRLPVDHTADDLNYAAVEFATTSISSSTLYSGAERSTRNSGAFRQVVVLESESGPRENWNNTVVNGLRSGFVAALTGSRTLSDFVRNDHASPGLSYMDANAHGYVIAKVEADAMTVTHVTVANARIDYGPEGAPVIRRATFRLPAWEADAQPVLQGPVFEGELPYPFG